MAFKMLMLLSLCGLGFAGKFETVNDKFHYADASADYVKAHLDCYLDAGPCDELSQSFKDHFPEEIATGCARCTDEQKNIAFTYVQAVQKYFPERIADIQKKYDPENKYLPAFFKAITPK